MFEHKKLPRLAPFATQISPLLNSIFFMSCFSSTFTFVKIKKRAKQINSNLISVMSLLEPTEMTKMLYQICYKFPNFTSSMDLSVEPR